MLSAIASAEKHAVNTRSGCGLEASLQAIELKVKRRAIPDQQLLTSLRSAPFVLLMEPL
jgi:hypothetical protein